MKKLLLCSGPRKAPYGDHDWFRVDSDVRTEPDLVCSLPPLPRRVIADGPWDRIALIHGIEHFYPWEAFALLVEIVPILKPDGLLILEQPNLAHCNGHAESIFGDPDTSNPAMIHRWGYTPATLSATLIACGFKRTVTKPALFHDPKRDFRMEASLC